MGDDRSHRLSLMLLLEAGLGSFGSDESTRREREDKVDGRVKSVATSRRKSEECGD
jgi:hypothetical protein